VALRVAHESVGVRAYKSAKHPVSGLPVMAPVRRGGRKVSAEEIARLNADLL
jgi:hypothetical protein